MKDPAEETTRTVKDWLAGDAAALLHGLIDPQRLRNIRERAHRAARLSEHPATSHFYLPGRDPSHPLCIKVFDVSRAEHLAFFRREVRMLRKLGRTSKDRALPLAPKVLLADDHTGIVVMDWVHGRSMKSELMWRYVLHRDTSTLLHDCGAWLRLFHQANGIAELPAPALAMMGDVEQLVAGLHGQARRSLLHSAGVLRVLEFLREEAASLDGMAVEWSLNHRDFTPSNLIRETSSGTIMGIDFGYAVERLPVAVDLGVFTVRTTDLTAGRLMPSSKEKRNVHSLFLGYRPDAGTDELRWFHWCALRVAVIRLLRREATYAHNSASIAGRVRLAIARRIAARTVTQVHSHRMDD